MSIHNDLLNLAKTLQGDVPARKGFEYKLARMEVSELINEILERYPLETGHEWVVTPCYWSLDPEAPADMREVCALCGTDRLLGDEAQPCDKNIPGEFTPNTSKNGW